jgi:hypothetical protein
MHSQTIFTIRPLLAAGEVATYVEAAAITHKERAKAATLTPIARNITNDNHFSVAVSCFFSASKICEAEKQRTSKVPAGWSMLLCTSS